MTPAQHGLYRGKTGLWAEACRVQGWDVKDEAKRRAITLQAAQAVNPASACDSTAHLNEDQITALFKLLAYLANPLSLDAARAVANPAETKDRDECRRVVHAINEYRFDRRYVQAIAQWACRIHQVPHWEELPLDKLKLLVRTVERRATSKGRKRVRSSHVVNYELKPRRMHRASEPKLQAVDAPY